MLSMHQILYSLIICLLVQKALPQESPDFAEEYIDEDLPESAGVEGETGSTAKPINPTANDLNHKKTTNFTEDRFTKLFGPRRNRPQPSSLYPKFQSKAKPTLPSFIKNTPPNIRVQPTQAPNPQRSNPRATTSTQRTTTTRTPLRGSNGNNGNNRRNQINNNNNRSNGQSTPSPTQSTTASSARRRFGGGGNRNFNTNSTIPATNRPKRS